MSSSKGLTMNESVFYQVMRIIISFIHQDRNYVPPPLVQMLSLQSNGQYHLHKLDGYVLVSVGSTLPTYNLSVQEIKSRATLNFGTFRTDIEDVFSKLAIRMGSLEMLTVMIVAHMALWIQSHDYHLIADYKEDGEINIYGNYGRDVAKINEIKIPPGVIYGRPQS